MDSFYERLSKQQFAQHGHRFTLKSAKWFMDRVRSIGREEAKADLLRQAKIQGIADGTKPKIGHMYTYLYDAKWKDELPYWDKFPLIFLTDIYKDGWLGINLHYLPVRGRAIFMYKLLGLTNNEKMDESTKLKLSYQILKSSTKYKEMQPCVKRYLGSQLRSKMLHIPASDWETALYLPTAQFVGASNRKVWKDSMRMI